MATNAIVQIDPLYTVMLCLINQEMPPGHNNPSNNAHNKPPLHFLCRSMNIGRHLIIRKKIIIFLDINRGNDEKMLSRFPLVLSFHVLAFRGFTTQCLSFGGKWKRELSFCLFLNWEATVMSNPFQMLTWV